MKKSEYKRQQREADKKAKPPSKMQQLQHAVNNLQCLLWLVARKYGGTIELTRAEHGNFNPSKSHLEILGDPETGAYKIVSSLLPTDQDKQETQH